MNRRDMGTSKVRHLAIRPPVCAYATSAPARRLRLPKRPWVESAHIMLPNGRRTVLGLRAVLREWPEGREATKAASFSLWRLYALNPHRQCVFHLKDDSVASIHWLGRTSTPFDRDAAVQRHVLRPKHAVPVPARLVQFAQARPFLGVSRIWARQGCGSRGPRRGENCLIDVPGGGILGS